MEPKVSSRLHFHMHTDPYGGERRTRTQCRLSWHDPLSRRSSDLPSSLSEWLGWMDLNHRVPVSEASLRNTEDSKAIISGLLKGAAVS